MSVETPERGRPLIERERASVAHVGDLVLLVLDAADEDGLDFETLVPHVVALVEDDEAFRAVETESAAVDAFDALELYGALGYVTTDSDTPTAQLTDRGDRAVAALRAALDDVAAATLTEVTEG